QLDRGAIDVAVAHLQNLPAHVDSMVLLRDPFVVVARKGHPAAAQPLSPEAYAAQQHALQSRRGTTTGALDRILAACGLKRPVAPTRTHRPLRGRSPLSRGAGEG